METVFPPFTPFTWRR